MEQHRDQAAGVKQRQEIGEAQEVAGQGRAPGHRAAVVAQHHQAERLLAWRGAVELHLAPGRDQPFQREHTQVPKADAELPERYGHDQQPHEGGEAPEQVQQPGQRARHRTCQPQAQFHAFGRGHAQHRIEHQL